MAKKVFIIGCGSVGTSIGFALSKAGREIIGLCDINAQNAKSASNTIGVCGYVGALPEKIKEADTVIVTVPDKNIEEVASLAFAEELFSKNQVWIHCSGQLTQRALDPIAAKVKGVGVIHPVFVFPPQKCTKIPEGIFFALGGNEAGLERAKTFVKLFKGRSIIVPDEAKSEYHAALVMASNYIVTMLLAAKDILSESGMDENKIEPLLISLSSSAVVRSKDSGILNSLSGPIRRGDTTTINNHIKALKKMPDIQKLYIETAKVTLKMANNIDSYDTQNAKSLDLLLKNS